MEDVFDAWQVFPGNGLVKRLSLQADAVDGCGVSVIRTVLAGRLGRERVQQGKQKAYANQVFHDIRPLAQYKGPTKYTK
jgi:hypothetical protein